MSARKKRLGSRRTLPKHKSEDGKAEATSVAQQVSEDAESVKPLTHGLPGTPQATGSQGNQIEVRIGTEVDVRDSAGDFSQHPAEEGEPNVSHDVTQLSSVAQPERSVQTLQAIEHSFSLSRDAQNVDRLLDESEAGKVIDTASLTDQFQDAVSQNEMLPGSLHVRTPSTPEMSTETSAVNYDHVKSTGASASELHIQSAKKSWLPQRENENTVAVLSEKVVTHTEPEVETSICEAITPAALSAEMQEMNQSEFKVDTPCISIAQEGSNDSGKKESDVKDYVHPEEVVPRSVEDKHLESRSSITVSRDHSELWTPTVSSEEVSHVITLETKDIDRKTSEDEARKSSNYLGETSVTDEELSLKERNEEDTGDDKGLSFIQKETATTAGNPDVVNQEEEHVDISEQISVDVQVNTGSESVSHDHTVLPDTVDNNIINWNVKSPEATPIVDNTEVMAEVSMKGTNEEIFPRGEEHDSSLKTTESKAVAATNDLRTEENIPTGNPPEFEDKIHEAPSLLEDFSDKEVNTKSDDVKVETVIQKEMDQSKSAVTVTDISQLQDVSLSNTFEILEPKETSDLATKMVLAGENTLDKNDSSTMSTTEEQVESFIILDVGLGPEDVGRKTSEDEQKPRELLDVKDPPESEVVDLKEDVAASAGNISTEPQDSNRSDQSVNKTQNQPTDPDKKNLEELDLEAKDLSHDADVSGAEKLSNSRTRRKLGSSRKMKGRQPMKSNITDQTHDDNPAELIHKDPSGDSDDVNIREQSTSFPETLPQPEESEKDVDLMQSGSKEVTGESLFTSVQMEKTSSLDLRFEDDEKPIEDSSEKVMKQTKHEVETSMFEDIKPAAVGSEIQEDVAKVLFNKTREDEATTSDIQPMDQSSGLLSFDPVEVPEHIAETVNNNTDIDVTSPGGILREEHAEKLSTNQMVEQSKTRDEPNIGITEETPLRDVESNYSFQMVPSEINSPLDSQTEDNAQNKTNFDLRQDDFSFKDIDQESKTTAPLNLGDKTMKLSDLNNLIPTGNPPEFEDKIHEAPSLLEDFSDKEANTKSDDVKVETVIQEEMDQSKSAVTVTDISQLQDVSLSDAFEILEPKERSDLATKMVLPGENTLDKNDGSTMSTTEEQVESFIILDASLSPEDVSRKMSEDEQKPRGLLDVKDPPESEVVDFREDVSASAGNISTEPQDSNRSDQSLNKTQNQPTDPDKNNLEELDLEAKDLSHDADVSGAEKLSNTRTQRKLGSSRKMKGRQPMKSNITDQTHDDNPAELIHKDPSGASDDVNIREQSTSFPETLPQPEESEKSVDLMQSGSKEVTGESLFTSVQMEKTSSLDPRFEYDKKPVEDSGEKVRKQTKHEVQNSMFEEIKPAAVGSEIQEDVAKVLFNKTREDEATTSDIQPMDQSSGLLSFDPVEVPEHIAENMNNNTDIDVTSPGEILKEEHAEKLSTNKMVEQSKIGDEPNIGNTEETPLRDVESNYSFQMVASEINSPLDSQTEDNAQNKTSFDLRQDDFSFKDIDQESKTTASLNLGDKTMKLSDLNNLIPTGNPPEFEDKIHEAPSLLEDFSDKEANTKSDDVKVETVIQEQMDQSKSAVKVTNISQLQDVSLSDAFEILEPKVRSDLATKMVLAGENTLDKNDGSTMSTTEEQVESFIILDASLSPEDVSRKMSEDEQKPRELLDVKDPPESEVVHLREDVSASAGNISTEPQDSNRSDQSLNKTQNQPTDPDKNNLEELDLEAKDLSHDADVSGAEKLSNTRTRRKLGSSRKMKGRQPMKSNITDQTRDDNPAELIHKDPSGASDDVNIKEQSTSFPETLPQPEESEKDVDLMQSGSKEVTGESLFTSVQMEKTSSLDPRHEDEKPVEDSSEKVMKQTKHEVETSMFKEIKPAAVASEIQEDVAKVLFNKTREDEATTSDIQPMDQSSGLLSFDPVEVPEHIAETMNNNTDIDVTSPGGILREEHAEKLSTNQMVEQSKIGDEPNIGNTEETPLRDVESNYSFQMVPSEINSPLDSQTEDNAQNKTNFDLRQDDFSFKDIDQESKTTASLNLGDKTMKLSDLNNLIPTGNPPEFEDKIHEAPSLLEDFSDKEANTKSDDVKVETVIQEEMDQSKSAVKVTNISQLQDVSLSDAFEILEPKERSDLATKMVLAGENTLDKNDGSTMSTTEEQVESFIILDASLSPEDVSRKMSDDEQKPSELLDVKDAPESEVVDLRENCSASAGNISTEPQDSNRSDQSLNKTQNQPTDPDKNNLEELDLEAKDLSHDADVSGAEKLSNTRTRRKLGSSRKMKGRQPMKSNITDQTRDDNPSELIHKDPSGDSDDVNIKEQSTSFPETLPQPEESEKDVDLMQSGSKEVTGESLFTSVQMEKTSSLDPRHEDEKPVEDSSEKVMKQTKHEVETSMFKEIKPAAVGSEIQEDVAKVLFNKTREDEATTSDIQPMDQSSGLLSFDPVEVPEHIAKTVNNNTDIDVTSPGEILREEHAEKLSTNQMVEQSKTRDEPNIGNTEETPLRDVESNYSFQMVPSEINSPLDSQTEDNAQNKTSLSDTFEILEPKETSDLATKMVLAGENTLDKNDSSTMSTTEDQVESFIILDVSLSPEDVSRKMSENEQKPSELLDVKDPPESEVVDLRDVSASAGNISTEPQDSNRSDQSVTKTQNQPTHPDKNNLEELDLEAKDLSHDADVSGAEKLSNTRTRRKLGSSRRNKGRQPMKSNITDQTGDDNLSELIHKDPSADSDDVNITVAVETDQTLGAGMSDVSGSGPGSVAEFSHQYFFKELGSEALKADKESRSGGEKSFVQEQPSAFQASLDSGVQTVLASSAGEDKSSSDSRHIEDSTDVLQKLEGALSEIDLSSQNETKDIIKNNEAGDASRNLNWDLPILGEFRQESTPKLLELSTGNPFAQHMLTMDGRHSGTTEEEPKMIRPPEETQNIQENLNENSERKKRKLGSTRKSQLNKPREDFSAEPDNAHLASVGDEVPRIITADVFNSLNEELFLKTVGEEQQETTENLQATPQDSYTLENKNGNPFLPELVTTPSQTVESENVGPEEDVRMFRDNTRTIPVVEEEPKLFDTRDILREMESGAGVWRTVEPLTAGAAEHKWNVQANAGEIDPQAHRRRKMGSTRKNLVNVSNKDELGGSEKTQFAKNPEDAEFEKIFTELDTKKEDPLLGTNLTSYQETQTPQDEAENSLFASHDIIEAESPVGGQRRKMGSHRGPMGERQTWETFADKEEEGLDIQTVVKEIPKSLVAGTVDGNRDKTPKREESRPLEQPRNVSLGGNSAGLIGDCYHVVMVGDSSVGKTSFMRRAQTGKFSLDIPPSIGIDTCYWTVIVDGTPVVLQLWDTAGQERFHCISRNMFYKAQAFLLMYDVTSLESFSNVHYWAKCIKEGAVGDVSTLLVGNKSDGNERKVRTEEGESLAKEFNMGFMEVSAATGDNVIESLERVARLVSRGGDRRERNFVLTSEPKTRSGCC